MLTCFPLDVVRTRILAAPRGSSPPPLRMMRSIAAAEGLGGLYAGCLPALISVAPSGAVFYGTYDVLKVAAFSAPRPVVDSVVSSQALLALGPQMSLAVGQHQEQSPNGPEVYCGCVASGGLPHVLSASCLMQSVATADQRRRHMVAQHAAPTVSVVLGCHFGTPAPGSMQERHLAGQRGRGEPVGLGTAWTLLYGGLAGVSAETAVYPLQVVQRYMQLHSAAGDLCPSVFISTLCLYFRLSLR